MLFLFALITHFFIVSDDMMSQADDSKLKFSQF